jgi:hypothetical protein
MQTAGLRPDVVDVAAGKPAGKLAGNLMQLRAALLLVVLLPLPQAVFGLRRRQHGSRTIRTARQ